jgi:hypothetical protein
VQAGDREIQHTGATRQLVVQTAVDRTFGSPLLLRPVLPSSSSSPSAPGRVEPDELAVRPFLPSTPVGPCEPAAPPPEADAFDLRFVAVRLLPEAFFLVVEASSDEEEPEWSDASSGESERRPLPTRLGWKMLPPLPPPVTAVEDDAVGMPMPLYECDKPEEDACWPLLPPPPPPPPPAAEDGVEAVGGGPLAPNRFERRALMSGEFQSWRGVADCVRQAGVSGSGESRALKDEQGEPAGAGTGEKVRVSRAGVRCGAD